MNEYMRLAGDYFRQFEGTHLYPGWKHWLPWACLCSFVIWVASFYVFFQPKTNASWGWDWGWRIALLVLAEIVFLVLCIVVGEYRKRSILNAFKASASAPISSLDDCRKIALSRLCRGGPHTFHGAAKECNELLALLKAHRSVFHVEIHTWWRKIYDPESKARLLSITLAGLALFVALFVRSIPPDSPSVFQAFADGTAFKMVSTFVPLACSVFAIWIGIHIIALTLLDGALFWVTKVFGKNGQSQTALRYFVRDLVRFHAPNAAQAGAKRRKRPLRPQRRQAGCPRRP